ncbi:MAG: hypothetical protein GXN91_00835 [Epsilonproteobacteria bacterium]|nr:hypothetical protein [Campylobacterota bacterium]
MKRGVLLSLIASGLIYAGGDIVPVEPVQEPVVPAAAVVPAACDFWGSVGLRYDANDFDTDDTEFGDAENNRFLSTIVLGGEKEIGYGFGIGAELAGSFLTDGEFNKIEIRDEDGILLGYRETEDAEISQLYATYKYGNTAIKAGRQALPKAVSPWAFSVRDLGMLERTYDGITIVNTDLADTTLVGAWIRSVADGTEDTKIGDKGLFMVGAINKSLADTTLSGAAYYIPDFEPDVDASSVWAAAETKFNNFDLGLQLAYADIDKDGYDSTVGVAGYVGTTYNNLKAKLTLAYINDGNAPLSLNRYGATDLYAPSSGFWGGTYRLFGGSSNPALGEQKIARLDVDYNIPGYGTIYAGVAADEPDNDDKDTAVAARVGYKFKTLGFNNKIEYRYYDDFDGNTKQRVRLETIYKF